MLTIAPTPRCCDNCYALAPCVVSRNPGSDEWHLCATCVKEAARLLAQAKRKKGDAP